MERCRHDIPRDQCYYCRDKASPLHPVELRLFFYRPRNQQSDIFGLTLNRDATFKNVHVFLKISSHYEGSSYLTVDESEIDTHSISRLDSNKQRDMLASLRKQALEEGLLFEPMAPLTMREQGPDGPPSLFRLPRAIVICRTFAWMSSMQLLCMFRRTLHMWVRLVY